MIPALPLAVLATGLVCGVGLTSEESCVAIRCGINNFRETRFAGSNFDWLIGSPVELERPQRGITHLAKMAAMAISECFALADDSPEQTPVLLSIAEPERPGRFDGLPQALLRGIETELEVRLHPDSLIIELGRVGGVVALQRARRMLVEQRNRRIIVAGVDTFLTGPTLASYDREDRLLRRDNSNGFIPGEAAGAVLLAAYESEVKAPIMITGLGFGREPAPLGSGKPLRADGLVAAIRGALDEAAIELKGCDHRIADVTGEQYRFKEAALAITRLLRDRKVMFGLWHPADCIGEVGAATLPAMIAVLFAGARKDYLPGPTFLGHLGGDDDKRTAFLAKATVPQSLLAVTRGEAAFSQRRPREVS